MEGKVRQIVLSNTDKKYCSQALEKDKTLEKCLTLCLSVQAICYRLEELYAEAGHLKARKFPHFPPKNLQLPAAASQTG